MMQLEDKLKTLADLAIDDIVDITVGRILENFSEDIVELYVDAENLEALSNALGERVYNLVKDSFTLGQEHTVPEEEANNTEESNHVIE